MPGITSLSRALGALALGAALAGCSMSDAPSVPEEPRPTATSAAPEQPDAPTGSETASPDASGESPDPLDGYVELADGTWIPADSPDGCAGPAHISLVTAGGTSTAEVLRPENLVDMGSRRFAEGEVGYDAQGRVATYTAAAGDVPGVIGERLCVYNGDLIGTLNGHGIDEPIHPGEVLVIDPAAVPGFAYEDPLG